MTTADGDRSAGLNLNRTDIDGLCGQLLEGKLLTVSDAQRCLKSIREKLTPEDYHEFLDIMKDFKEGRLDRSGVREKVIKLCGTHQELLALFNIYLPEREKITFPQAEDDVKKRVQLEVCMQYVEKVKMRLQDDDHLYRCFLGVLDLYRKGKRTVVEVHQAVTYLFYNHKDLLKEFTTLFCHTNSFKDANTHKEHKSSPTTSTPIRHLHSKKETIASGSEPPRRDEKGKKIIKCSAKVNDQPMRKRIVPKLEETLKSKFPQDMHGQVCSLLKKVKERLYNTDNFRSVLNSEKISRPQLKAQVKDLLGSHPDLMEEFNKVVDHVKKTDKAKEDQSLNKNGKRKRQSLLITPGSKRSQLSNNDKKNKHGADVSNGQSRTPSCRLIPCDFIIPEASQRRRWINRL
ncbi:putative transcription regulator Others family [Helianthus annuus]|nr:putative transcription regulator Others family [Helianthus annuus]